MTLETFCDAGNIANKLKAVVTFESFMTSEACALFVRTS